MSRSKKNRKVQLSKQGQEKVKKILKLKGNGWNTRCDSKAIDKATYYCFKQNIYDRFKDGRLELKTLVKLLKNIFEDGRSNQEILSKYKESEKSNPNQQIKVEDLSCEIKKHEVTYPGITYIGWKKFYSGKKIKEYVFDAFWCALGLPFIDKDKYKEPCHKDVADNFANRNSNKENILVNKLSMFNHELQINLLEDSLYKGKRVFLINNLCLYSRVWMLRRLEKNFLSDRRVKTLTYSQKSSYMSSGINNFQYFPNQEYPNDQPEKLNNLLKTNYLFVVIDINDYDLKSLETLINKLQQEVFIDITEMEQGGKLLIFLLAKGDKKNDWQGNKWQESNILKNEIVELKPANPFSSKEHIKELSKVVRKIRIDEFQELSTTANETPETVADNLINKSKGNTEKLLMNIYEHFNVSRKEFAQAWQRYP